MEAKLPVTFLAVLAVAVAGCTGTPAEPVGPTTSPPSTMPPAGNVTPPDAPEVPEGPEVLTFERAVTGAGVPGGPKVSLGLSEHFFEFELPENRTGLVVEAAWEGTDTLELSLFECQSDPDCPFGESVEGTSPLKIVVVDPARLALAGAWGGAAFVAGATPGTPYVAYVSIFTGDAPADSYTAIPPGA